MFYYFQGIVTSAITYPRYRKDLNYIWELKQSNLTLAIHNRHMNIFVSSLDSILLNSLSSRIENVNDKKIKKIFDDNRVNYAVLLRNSDGEQICRKPFYMKNGEPLYHIMNECPVPTSVVYGLRFGSPHLPRLNQLLFFLQQAGILKHWLQTDQHNLYDKDNKQLYIGNSKERKPLTMKILREVFYVWFFGAFISVCVFVIEISLRFLKRL